jgi:hypothetical protein
MAQETTSPTPSLQPQVALAAAGEYFVRHRIFLYASSQEYSPATHQNRLSLNRGKVWRRL